MCVFLSFCVLGYICIFCVCVFLNDAICPVGLCNAIARMLNVIQSYSG